MIPVKPVPEPADFDRRARRPGNRWLAGNPNKKRPRDYWSKFRCVLEDGFEKRCGYAAMHDPTGGTVDHYLSYRNHPYLTYEWSNYRFVSHTINSSKKNADESVLDPYEIKESWFEIKLPSLQLHISDKIPDEFREKARYTLDRLKLRDGETILRWRRSWYEMYEKGELNLDGLYRVAPLLARAVERRDSGGTV